MQLLDEHSKRLQINTQIPLFKHQEAILYRLVELESTPRNEILVGVLRDEPGVGKSYPMLALMLHEKRTFNETQNLIVVPNNIHQQWIDYIKAFAGEELSAISLIAYGDITRLLYDPRILQKYDIILTTATCYQILADTMISINKYFNRVVIDEVDTISFFTKCKMPCQASWLISGTIDLLKSGGYSKLLKTVHVNNIIKCSDEFVKKSIKLPEPLVISHRCFNEHVHILEKVLPTNDPNKGVSMLYALDYSDIKYKYHSGTVTTAADLFSAIYNDYALESMSLRESIDSLTQIASWQPSVLHGLQEKKHKDGSTVERVAGLDLKVQKLKDIESAMTILKSSGNKKYCLLCGHNLSTETRVATECCQTRFHQRCLENWLRISMQCCHCAFKKPKINKKTSELLNPDHYLDVVDYKLDETEVSNGCFEHDLHLYKDKIDELNDILDTERQGNMKMLIFSDYVSTFLPVKNLLEKKGITYTELQGNQDLIAKAIEDYRNSDIPILLIHSKQFGAGLNLEIAKSVVLMHKTPRCNQLIGRSQRFKRSGRLTIHHLLYLSEGN